MAITVPAVGDTGTAAWADSVANMLNGLATTLLFTPGGNTDTPGAGTATWVTLGNVTVPTWSTSCMVNVTCDGIFDTTTTANATAQLKIGSVGGAVNKRLMIPGVTSQRFGQSWNDLLTGLSTGSQSVTLSATFVASGPIRADTTAYFTVGFIFLQ